jgi:type I site-specific restriction-modification system R (restriction) subunit
LRTLLNVASGGVVFTTIQKFMPEEKGGKAPELSKRRNIIVIADEAHRSQYDLIDGLALPARPCAGNLRDSLPNASFIGLTPSLPSSVGLRPALRAVYVGRCAPSSIHPDADREGGRRH